MTSINPNRSLSIDMADEPPPPPPKTPITSDKSGNSTSTETETTSTDHSHSYNNNSNSNGNTNNLIPPPPPSTQSSPLLSPPPLLLVEIEEGTPAAEALRANRNVRVSKVLKAARSTKLQAGVRVLKSAARRGSGLPGHAGDRRGAPAFVSPRDLAAEHGNNNNALGNANGGGGEEQQMTLNASGVPPPTIPEVDDEGDSDAGSRSKDALNTTSASEASVGLLERRESFASEQTPSIDLDLGNNSQHWDGETDANNTTADNIVFGAASPPPQQYHYQQQHQALPQLQQPSYMVHSLLLANSTNNNQTTHAALPAAVAAACRAGEELERRRGTINSTDQQQQSTNHRRVVSQGDKHLPNASPTNTPRWSLFKSYRGFSPSDDNKSKDSAENHSQNTNDAYIPPQRHVRRRSSMSNIDTSARPTIFRRSSSSASNRMPSEISVAETQKHANLTDDPSPDFEDLSDDEILTAEFQDKKRTSNLGEDDDEDVVVKKTPVDPIVIKLPDQFNNESEEDTASKTPSKGQKEATGEKNRQAGLVATKKKPMKSKRFLTLSKEDNEAFHFHGPNSVRRWVSRRKTKESADKIRSYVKGKVIDGKHELYTMSIAVMLGMRTSIGRTNMEMSETAHNKLQWLDNDDLMEVVKYVFPPRGGTITPPHPLSHTFKFKDYSPLGFAYLRRMFGVNEYDFLLSVCGNANYIEFQSNAKSGQFFFYSKDGKYMIKTMTNAESKFLRRILPHYFRHCSLNPNTLVTKFLGMYRVKLYHLRRNVKFVVMKSVYDTDKHLDQLFDVKGSSKGRDARPGEAVKKDNDVRRALPEGAFVLEPGLRDKLRIQVQKDCEWLKSMKIMDYSMLIGVHNIASSRMQRRPIKIRSMKVPSDQDSVISTSSAKSQQSIQSVRNLHNDDGDEISNSSVDASHAAMLERYLDDDDDDSYLKGSVTRKPGKKRDPMHIMDDSSCSTLRLVQSVEVEDESTLNDKLKAEALVEQAIQDMYWPFHRYYDIQGRRRVNPIRSSLVTDNRKKGPIPNIQLATTMKGPMSLLSSIHESNVESVLDNGGRVDLPAFEQPLSFRKDGGFMMDLTGMQQPLKLSVPGAPEMVEYCDGKIFYMGIIDILQQFNIRKRVEAKYRRIGTKGWEAASCVHPTLYADRFVRFFDEYTEGINLRENNESASTSEKEDEQEESNEDTPNGTKDKDE